MCRRQRAVRSPISWCPPPHWCPRCRHGTGHSCSHPKQAGPELKHRFMSKVCPKTTLKSETSEFSPNEDCFYSNLKWPSGIAYAITSIIKLQIAQVSSFHSAPEWSQFYCFLIIRNYRKVGKHAKFTILPPRDNINILTNTFPCPQCLHYKNKSYNYFY